MECRVSASLGARQRPDHRSEFQVMKKKLVPVQDYATGDKCPKCDRNLGHLTEVVQGPRGPEHYVCPEPTVVRR